MGDTSSLLSLANVFIGLRSLMSQENKMNTRRTGLCTEHTRVMALEAALPLESLEPATCNETVSEEGLSGGSDSAGADERLTAAWLTTWPPRPSCPRLTQSAQSLLPARSLTCCRGLCAQKETTLLKWPQLCTRGARMGNSGSHASLWLRET